MGRRGGRPRTAPPVRPAAGAPVAASTSERILDAALTSFGGRGYEGTSLDALAAGLEVRKQTILYWFPSKEALLEAVVDRSVAELSGALEASLAGAGSGWAQVEAVVRSVFRLAARRPALLGLVREEVPVYGSGGFTTYAEPAARTQLEHWTYGLGIPRVKIKIGESWGTEEARDLARIAFARRVIGPDTELYVDANGGYTRKQAVRMGRAMACHGVTWFEEPVSSDDLDGLREVRDRVDPDVAAGEYGYDLPYFARMVDARAVDCLQVDVTRCGGITEWLRAAAVAAARGLQVSAHCAPNLHAHVAAAVPNLRHLEYFHDHVRIETMLFDGALDPAGGVLRPDPARPGHGLSLKEQNAAPYRVA